MVACTKPIALPAAWIEMIINYECMNALPGTVEGGINNASPQTPKGYWCFLHYQISNMHTYILDTSHRTVKHD